MLNRSGKVYLALVWLAALLSGHAVAAENVSAYIGATLIDGRGGDPVTDSVMLIEGDRIAAVGKVGEIGIPHGARRVDVSGKFLVPGFIDTHVHFMESGRIHMDKTMQLLDPTLKEEEDIAWLKERLPFTLSRYTCSGVTTLVSVGGPIHIEFEGRRIAEKQHDAPRVLIAGGPISNTGFEWIFDGENATFPVATEAEIRALVRKFHKLGADGIKLGYVSAMMGAQPEATPAEFAPVLAAATDEAHKLGMPVLTHIMARATGEAIVDTGMDALAHFSFDRAFDEPLLQKLVDKGVKVAPTISIFPKMLEVFDGRYQQPDIEKVCADPEAVSSYTNYVDSMVKQVYYWGVERVLRSGLGNAEAVVAENVQKFQQLGGELIIGSDAAKIGSPHGSAFHVEMQFLEKHGASPMSLLKAATLNAAEVMRVDDKLGSLEQGKLADFLILNKNPLTTIANAQYIDSVIIGGRRMKQADLVSTAAR